MPGQNFKIVGLDNLRDMLRSFDNVFQRKVIEDIFRAAAKPLIQKARQKAPDDEGDLVKSLGTFTSRSQDRGIAIKGAIWAGPRTRGGFKGFHAHLIEFGTKERKPKGEAFAIFEYKGSIVYGAKRAKALSPKPFMQPAYNEAKSEMERIIKEDSAKILQKNFNKYRK